MDYKEKYLKYSTDNTKKNKDYYLKYQKYKKKYLELKRNLSGGNNINLKKPLYSKDDTRRNNKLKDNLNLNIKRTKFFDIVNTLQTSKEDNVKYKIVIENQKNEIDDIKNKLNEMKNIYMLNEKLTIMDMENGYGKLY